jgi:hypothetical protein
LKQFIAPEQLIAEAGGLDQFNFEELVKSAPRNALLTPRMWVDDVEKVKDYYPPEPENPYKTPSEGILFEPAKELFVCKRCLETPCKLCRLLSGLDTYYAGWTPVDLSKPALP